MKSGWIHVAGGGCRGQSRKALVSGYFQVPRSLQASNSWYQASIKHISMCINAHTHTQKPTSHLHGTRWCWECDVHLDSSVRRLVLLNPHQSCSASPAVQETTPEKKTSEGRQSATPGQQTAITQDILYTHPLTFSVWFQTVRTHQTQWKTGTGYPFKGKQLELRCAWNWHHFSNNNYCNSVTLNTFWSS